MAQDEKKSGQNVTKMWNFRDFRFLSKTFSCYFRLLNCKNRTIQYIEAHLLSPKTINLNNSSTLKSSKNEKSKNENRGIFFDFDEKHTQIFICQTFKDGRCLEHKKALRACRSIKKSVRAHYVLFLIENWRKLFFKNFDSSLNLFSLVVWCWTVFSRLQHVNRRRLSPKS